MKRMSLLVLLFLTSIFSVVSFSDPLLTEKSFQPVKWLSKGVADNVRIENANSQPLIIQISVEKIITTEGAAKDTMSAGVNIKNCGAVTHLAPGDSAICNSLDAANPVIISSDSDMKLAMGTYEVKIQ